MNYIENLPEVSICSIISEIENVTDLINFLKEFPRVISSAEQIVTYLYSDKLCTIKLLDIISFKNLIISSNNVIVNITGKSEDFIMIKDYKRLKQMNFYIGTFDDEHESLEYLDSFIMNIPKKDLHEKTFRLTFEVGKRNYAYIIDRGYFTIANINQIRGLDNQGYYSIISSIIFEIGTIFRKYFPKIIIYTAIYNKTKSRYYCGDKRIQKDLFDINVTNEFIQDSMIILVKSDTASEIYYPSEYIKRISEKFGLNTEFITNKSLLLLLITYGSKYNLVKSVYDTEKKKDRIEYIRIWDDKLFIKYFNKQLFIDLYKNEYHFVNYR